MSKTNTVVPKKTVYVAPIASGFTASLKISVPRAPWDPECADPIKVAPPPPTKKPYHNLPSDRDILTALDGVELYVVDLCTVLQDRGFTISTDKLRASLSVMHKWGRVMRRDIARDGRALTVWSKM